MLKQVLVVTGPTATGKTALGVALAKKLNGEIVSADSMQVYRRMNIGTAKVTPEEAQSVPHHMIDVAEPSENFSVARYVELAGQCCEEIFLRDHLPIIVGGTGLYIDSLLSGRSFAERSPQENNIRKELEAEYDQLGPAALWEQLREIDPDRADKLSPNDRKRVIRALEIFRLTGKTISQHDAETKALPPRYDALTIALDFELREDLYKRINDRVDRMISNGLCDEVKQLVDQGLNPEHTSMQAIGYKEILLALNGTLSLDEAIDQIKQESRRYAKRQLTWLRRNPDVHWLRWGGDPDLGSGLDYCLAQWNSFSRSSDTKEVDK